ncbi:DUF4172 domain-containing protein [Cyclobacterium amurskyense]|uniref:DUF4172 domain-containing protein n=1 Tax=Cyclobacterium amurskyense TaxID=320787 RepID=UPI0021CDBFDA|nr:DUF4172 domain-containing protein [Cyclobacterium amurskyense]
MWERPNWPNFTFDASAFIHLEREFHRNTGLILGSLSPALKRTGKLRHTRYYLSMVEILH